MTSQRRQCHSNRNFSWWPPGTTPVNVVCCCPKHCQIAHDCTHVSSQLLLQVYRKYPKGRAEKTGSYSQVFDLSREHLRMDVIQGVAVSVTEWTVVTAWTGRGQATGWVTLLNTEVTQLAFRGPEDWDTGPVITWWAGFATTWFCLGNHILAQESQSDHYLYNQYLQKIPKPKGWATSFK